VATTAGHHHGSPGAWLAVFLIIAGFTVGVFALIFASLPLWIIAGVGIVVGAIIALASRIMEQAY
jgi:xanthine/uracil permease